LLRRLEWQVVRRLDGRLQGAYRTVWRGAGIDFTDLREYTPETTCGTSTGTSPRGSTSRSSRQYTEDRDLTAWLVLDRSASMRFGAAPHGKDFGAHRAGRVPGPAALARAATGSARSSTTTTHTRWFRPRTGRPHTLRLAHELARPPPGKAPRHHGSLPR
jgi:uncharacterized protein (DUF58 family)